MEGEAKANKTFVSICSLANLCVHRALLWKLFCLLQPARGIQVLLPGLAEIINAGAVKAS